MSRTWAQRFDSRTCSLWRDLQTELSDYGPTSKARSLENAIRMHMGVTADRELPAKKLHQASFSTRSTRPEMIDLFPRPGPCPGAGGELRNSPDDATAQTEPTPKSEPLSDELLLDLYRQTQEDLARKMPFTLKVSAVVDLEREMVRALDLNPLDRTIMEAMTEELHLRAFEDATRPDRIILDVPDGSPME